MKSVLSSCEGGITYNPVVVKKEAPEADGPAMLTPMEQVSPDQDIPMEEAEELEAGEVVVKEEGEDNDAMLNAIENAIQVTEAEEKATAEDENLDVGTSSEQMFSTGMASTLDILQQQGLLSMPTADQTDHKHVQLQCQWLRQDVNRLLLTVYPERTL
jgi:U4/U6.U5 tri-snRNP-associated protein 1